MVPHPPGVGGWETGQCVDGASPTWGWGGGGVEDSILMVPHQPGVGRGGERTVC